jgi:parvulin-like peptidyl-prolyl isomerase
MTFRTKPVVKRSSKSSWESRDRRNLLLNVGFGIVVVAAVLILLAAIGVSYYDQNLASVGSVNGQGISKAELRDRTLIEQWRLEEAVRRIRTQRVAGQLTDAQAQLQEQIIAQQQQQLVPLTLEHLIDNKIQAQLAEREGIAVTDADVDAKLTEEATTPENRHAWVIEVEPTLDDGAVEPTAAQIAEAKSKADAALKDLQGGKAWDEVAKTVSTDTSTAPQAGDLGWLTAEDSQADEPFLEAIFGATVDSPTAVVEGEDGIFRIGRVTEIAPEAVNEGYQDQIVNDGIDLAAYRGVVRGDVIRQKLEDKAVADAIKPGPQRDVAEIYVSQETLDLDPKAVKVRHILFSPNDDPSAAQSGDLAEDDPAWTKAKADADAAYAQLQADPTKFEALARELSDEESARGPNGTGGLLGAYVARDGQYVEEFESAVLDADASDGEVIAPFRSPFGYHIVQVVSHRPTMDDLVARLGRGEDFATLARDVSEAESAPRGGELGWIAKGQLGEQQTAGIFGAQVPGVSDVVTVKDDGSYLFDVRAEETRTPEGRQLEQLRSSAFGDWYTFEKNKFEITRDEAISNAVG